MNELPQPPVSRRTAWAERAAIPDPPTSSSWFFNELAKPAPKPWLIKNVIALGEGSSWIAPPGKRKSTLLTGISVHLAAGLDWRRYRTKGRHGVLYFALERADLVERRVAAYGLRDGLKDLPIAVATRSLTS
jgi:RecA-family ATPase